MSEKVDTPDRTKKKVRFSLSTNILLGVVLGICCGIFFGEYCGFLGIIGDGFIRLLQMTILPYIIVSLIYGIGGLTYEQAKMLALKAGTLLLFFWVITFAVILVIPLSFPKWESAAFFSTALVEEIPKIDYLQLYIPSNPFWAMANNIVPAVVLFAILLGVAMIGIREKTALLVTLDTVTKGLMRVTNMVVQLTPIGVFAISASAAGTMSLEEFGRLQVYLVSFNAACLLLSFVILPLLLQPVTPFKYRDIIGLSSDALLTAFTTGNLFVVLPVLTENCKALFDKYKLTRKQTGAYVDVLIPVSFNFPNTGKLIMLLFVLFAGWFIGSMMPVAKYPSFVISGLLSFFGGVDVALPFMLNLLHLPSDMYQLYMVTGVINGRTATLLAAMHLLVFTLLATSAMTGTLTLNRKKMVRMLLICLLATAGVMVGCRVYFTLAVNNDYDRDKVLARMHLLNEPAPARVHKKIVEGVDSKPAAVAEIKKRGVLRVGFNPDRLPFAFFNDAGELVGYDVKVAYMLADDLEVDLEFFPIKYGTMAEALNRGWIDIGMSGIQMTVSTFEKMAFTTPYLNLTYSFVVPDYLRDSFADLQEVQKMDDLKIAILDDRSMEIDMQEVLPKAEIIPVKSFHQYFAGNIGTLDAIMMSAEAGSAWTLMYPHYSVVVPKPEVSTFPVGYAVAKDNSDLLNFMNSWLAMMKKRQGMQRNYDRWILGKGAEEKKPRWSVIRNVLHWVK